MANPAFPAGAFFKHVTVVPGVLERKSKRTARQTALDRAHEVVDERDGKQCQLRGTPLTAGHVDEWRRLERHHLASRSTDPQERDNPDAILTVSKAVHDLFEAGAVYAIDKHGELTKRVSRIFGYRWNEAFFPKGKRHPFRLPKDRIA